MHKALFTLDEAASILSLSPRTVSRLLQKGEIPAVRIGRLVRVRAADLHVWVERQADWGVDASPQSRPARGNPMSRESAAVPF